MFTSLRDAVNGDDDQTIEPGNSTSILKPTKKMGLILMAQHGMVIDPF